MARKRYTPEQVVNLLRQIEVAVANGNKSWQNAVINGDHYMQILKRIFEQFYFNLVPH